MGDGHLSHRRRQKPSSKIGLRIDISRFSGHGGVELAYREAGSGRPLILLHGFMGTGSDWLDQGPAETLAEQGFCLFLPDFRGHGESTRSRDPLAYPPDVLADDGLTLIEHLGLGAGEYDLGGYSLGGRVVVRMLARGAEPGRAVVAGQIGADPRVLLHVLGSLVPTPEDDLRRITTPTLVVIGDRDERSDADELAALLPAGCYVCVPGDHGDSFGAPEFAAAITAFFTAHNMLDNQ
jgi:pimeloyl-ACP methyl ester carboxylesterase